METPIKSTRRILKKVMRKNKASLSISSSNLYQKKLKSAINVSLNSTRTVRTLQANNRSLATSLEKMRKDFRQVQDHYTFLLEENHELREKILELQRVDMSERQIEHEATKKFKAQMVNVRGKLGILGSHAEGFLDTLKELTDLCLACSSPSVDDISSSNTAHHNYSLLSHLQIHSNDSSLADATDIELCRVGEKTVGDAGLPEFESPLQKKKKQPLEPEKSTQGSGFPVKPAAEKKLPMRIPRCPKQPIRQTNEGMHDLKNLKDKTSSEAQKQVLRRETFILATNDPPDVSLLTDIAMPQFLVSAATHENEMTTFGNLDSSLSVTSPRKEKKSIESTLQKGNARRLSQTSVKPSSLGTSPRIVRGSPKSSSPLQQTPSPSKKKQARKQRLTRSKPVQSPKGPTSPSPSQASGKSRIINGSSGDQKPLTPDKKKRTPLSPLARKVSPSPKPPPGDKQKQNLYISNEFKLVNIHKQKTELSSQKLNTSLVQHGQPSQGAEHTIFPVDDMELTRMEEEALTLPTKLSELVTSICVSNNKKFSENENLSTTQRSSGSKQIIEASAEVEEKVPDAITMRFTKPGQFMFAASRKDTDGTRKNPPAIVPKARSKSKKLTTTTKENSPEKIPKSVFDFHEKTPVALKNKKQAASVFSLSADESSLSPLMSLNKNRSHCRKSTGYVHVSSRSQSLSSDAEATKKIYPLLNENFTFEVEVPLKDESPKAKSKYRTRSSSRGRQRNDSDSGNEKGRQTRSLSRKRRTETQTDCPASAKTPSRSSVSLEELTNQISEPSAHPHSGSLNSMELWSSQSKSETFIAVSHLVPELDKKSMDNIAELLGRSRRKSVLFQSEKVSQNEPEIKAQYKRQIPAKKREQNKVTDKDVALGVDDHSVLEKSKQSANECLKSLDSNFINVRKGENLKEAGEITCLSNSVTFSSKSQNISHFSPGLLSEATTSTDCYEKYCCDEESTTATKNCPSLDMFNPDILSGATLRRKKKTRSKSTSHKIGESSPRERDLVTNYSDSFSSDLDFIMEKTRGEKKEKCNGSGESETQSESKSSEPPLDGIAAEGDIAMRSQFSRVKDVYEEAGPVSKLSQDSSQLLETLRKIPALSFSEERIHSESTVPSNGKYAKPKEDGHGPKTSRIVKVPPLVKRPASVTSPENLTSGSKRRRAATKVNYAELPMNVKLRRGDPFTSHYCSTDKIEIYKSPKSKAKKKVIRRDVLGSLHNFSISEEPGLTTDNKA